MRTGTAAATAFKYVIAAPRSAWLTLRYVTGMSGSRSVWLTFDDGPHPAHTAKILEILDRRSIRATFFVIGMRARVFPELVRNAFDSGHRIGNHSFSHPDFTTLTKGEIRDEIVRAEDAIGRYLGEKKLFRPPYGHRNAEVDAVTSELGYQMVLWNVSTRDWNERYQPDRWVQHGVKLVRIGSQSRILLHDDRELTADRLDVLLDRIGRLGNVTFMPPDTVY